MKVETTENTKKMHRDAQSGSYGILCVLCEKTLWTLWLNGMGNCEAKKSNHGERGE